MDSFNLNIGGTSVRCYANSEYKMVVECTGGENTQDRAATLNALLGNLIRDDKIFQGGKSSYETGRFYSAEGRQISSSNDKVIHHYQISQSDGEGYSQPVRPQFMIKIIEPQMKKFAAEANAIGFETAAKEFGHHNNSWQTRTERSESRIKSAIERGLREGGISGSMAQTLTDKIAKHVIAEIGNKR